MSALTPREEGRLWLQVLNDKIRQCRRGLKERLLLDRGLEERISQLERLNETLMKQPTKIPFSETMDLLSGVIELELLIDEEESEKSRLK